MELSIVQDVVFFRKQKTNKLPPRNASMKNMLMLEFIPKQSKKTFHKIMSMKNILMLKNKLEHKSQNGGLDLEGGFLCSRLVLGV